MKRFLAATLILMLLCGSASALTYNSGTGLPVILAVGGSFVYARDNQGKLYVWGDNQYGQLGLGSVKQSYTIRDFKSKNVQLDMSKLTDIVTASDYSFLWMEDGTFYGVGNNSYYPLTVAGWRHETHVMTNFAQTPVDVKTGFGHVLALTASGEVYAWGRNNRGQVGNGFHKNQMTPYKVPLENIVQIAAGGKFSLALDKDGVLWGWGDNEYHMVNPNTTRDQLTPVRIDYGDIDIEYIDACGASVVLLDTKGTLWTWGRNDMQQLGYDTKREPTKKPRSVPLPLPVTYVAAYSSQTYAILTDGSLWSWGNNSYGQLGQGFRSAASQGVLPGKAYDKDVVMVMGGSLFAIAMTKDGTVLCAGINKFSQLGDGTSKSKYSMSPNGLDLILP